VDPVPSVLTKLLVTSWPVLVGPRARVGREVSTFAAAATATNGCLACIASSQSDELKMRGAAIDMRIIIETLCHHRPSLLSLKPTGEDQYRNFLAQKEHIAVAAS
jgi:hypothetical protein